MPFKPEEGNLGREIPPPKEPVKKPRPPRPGTKAWREYLRSLGPVVDPTENSTIIPLNYAAYANAERERRAEAEHQERVAKARARLEAEFRDDIEFP